MGHINGFARSSASEMFCFISARLKRLFFRGYISELVFVQETSHSLSKAHVHSIRVHSIPVEFPQIHWNLSMVSQCFSIIPYNPGVGRAARRCGICSAGAVGRCGNGPVEWAVGPTIGSWKMLKTKICSSKLWFLSRKGFNSSGRKTWMWPRKCSISTRNTFLRGSTNLQAI